MQMYFRNFIGHFLPLLLFVYIFKKGRWEREAERFIGIVALISAENHFSI